MGSATPRRAASLILLRRGGKHRQPGVEVLLVRRNPEASFMPGVWVFPGGVVETGDSVEGEAGARGDELAHRACAVRNAARFAVLAGRAGFVPTRSPNPSDVRVTGR